MINTATLLEWVGLGQAPFPHAYSLQNRAPTVPHCPKPVLSTVRLPALPPGSSDTHLLSSLVAVPSHKQLHVCVGSLLPAQQPPLSSR